MVQWLSVRWCVFVCYRQESLRIFRCACWRPVFSSRAPLAVALCGGIVRTPAAARMTEDYKSLLAQQRATVHSLVSHRKAEAAAKWMDAAQVHPSKRSQAHPGWWSSSDEDDEVSMEPARTVQTPWGASDRWRTVQSPSESAQARTRSRSRRASSPGSEVRVRREHGLRVPTSPSAKPAPEPRPRLSSLALRRE